MKWPCTCAGDGDVPVVCLWCGVVVLWSVATLKGIMVPPVVCPRLFEFLTTWTLITLPQQHSGLREKKKNAKKQ